MLPPKVCQSHSLVQLEHFPQQQPTATAARGLVEEEERVASETIPTFWSCILNQVLCKLETYFKTIQASSQNDL